MSKGTKKQCSFFRRTTALTRPAAATGLLLAFGLPLGVGITTPAVAQDYTSGAIKGLVQDTAGNPIAGASVVIKSRATGVTQEVSTSSTGLFQINGLPAGTYVLTAEADGYKKESVANAKVAASASAAFTLTLASAKAADGVEQVVVHGVRQTFDFSKTTTGTNLNVPDLLENVPVARNLTSLILMAPNASAGDRSFGNLAAIGGASVAENAYYVNGINITDFNHYLGGSTVPFDFYNSVEVKTGGYPAEYGRATGGIVNAVTKSGSNDFTASMHLNYAPDWASWTSPDTYSMRNGKAQSSDSSVTLEAGGALIKDHLFAYGLAQFRDVSTRAVSKLSSVSEVDETKSPFFGLKLDGYVTDDHHLEFTVFDTRNKTSYRYSAYDVETDHISSVLGGLTEHYSGGISWVGKYTGHIFDWLTVSTAYGENRNRDEDSPRLGSSSLPYVADRTVAGVFCGDYLATCTTQTETIVDYPQRTDRKFIRADVDILFSLLGDHHVRAGFDRENNTLEHTATRTGPDGTNKVLYYFRRCATSKICSTGSGASLGLTADSYYVELNYYKTGGKFKSENSALYIQDEFKPSLVEGLTLNLGVRLDEFNNFTADGSQYLKLHGNYAPRVGFSYTPPWLNENGRFFGNFGEYYLPVAGNTAFRQGAAETYFKEYWTTTGTNTQGIPVIGTQLINWTGAVNCPMAITDTSIGAGSKSCAVTSDGTVQNPTSSVSHSLKATREQEIILGYEHKLDELWTVGVTYTNRALLVSAEDVSVDAAVQKYCDAHGISGCSSIWSGFNQYVIINPGKAARVTLNTPLPGTTSDCPDATALCTLDFSAAYLGYPKAQRKYDEVTFSFNRAFDGVWSLSGSYTWSRSRGNTEGYVSSDFEQDDAGITQDFDTVNFTRGAYGYLPNDRRHRFKLWGSYQLTEALQVGSQMSLESPRKQSCWGYDPTGDYVASVDNNSYGAASHYCGGVLSPRGHGPKDSWIYSADVSGRYNFDISTGQKAALRVDIFNIFNMHGVVKRNDVHDNNVGDFEEMNPNYNKPRQYQTPRYVRFGLDLKF